ncbi:MAG: hypothetical protein K9J80_09675 [Sulfuritalea sp.]|nr:hypothetical protein [Sulfuritalea sp.]
MATVALWLLVAGAAAQGPQRMPERGAGTGGPQRMFPAESVREQAAAEDSVASRRDHRLSAEERRQLRRDVHEAGRDLYMQRKRTERGEARRE